VIDGELQPRMARRDLAERRQPVAREQRER